MICYHLREKKRRKRLVQEIDNFVKVLIEERTKESITSQESQDLLTLLIQARDGDKKLSNQELKDLVLTFLIAGHETTSQLLSWILYAISQHPEVRDKCVDEILQFYPTGKFNNLEQNSLPYISNVIKETLRLYTPVPMIKRNLEKTSFLGGFEIPAGTECVISPMVIHNLPSLWKDPHLFNPSRWDEEEKNSANMSKKFIPFLSGSRNCIGSKFSLIEAKTILSVLLFHFNFEFLDQYPIEKKMKITLHPWPKLMMKLTKRVQNDV